MNTQRVTVSLPIYLYQQLTEKVKSGEVSGFIARAVEDKLMCTPESKEDAVTSFLKLRNKLPKFTKQVVILALGWKLVK